MRAALYTLCGGTHPVTTTTKSNIFQTLRRYEFWLTINPRATIFSEEPPH